jgi:acetyl esterase
MSLTLAVCGFPRSLNIISAADALIYDTNFMEARWRMAGNKTYLALFPDAAHGFNLVPLRIAKIANNMY